MLAFMLSLFAYTPIPAKEMTSPSKRLFSRSHDGGHARTPEKQQLSTVKEYEEIAHQNDSPLVTTAKRPRVLSGERGSQATQSQIPPPSFLEPSPAPKKPRLEQLLHGIAEAKTEVRRPGVAHQHSVPATAVRLNHHRHVSAEAAATPMPTKQQATPTSSQFETPISTQLFEPDEPLTATQEAVLADGYDMPSPPPFFVATHGDDGGAGVEFSPKVAKQGGAVEWAEATKAFFEFIDQRRVIDVDDS